MTPSMNQVTVVCGVPGKIVACADDRPLDRRQRTVGSEAGTSMSSRVVLTCGCEVTTSRDFLGRVVGTIVTRSDACAREDHVVGQVVLMPGRENAAGTAGANGPSS